MKYLVTGGAGFIGAHLTVRLLSEGRSVRVLDNFSTGTPANLPSLAASAGRLEIVDGDVRDLPTVERAAAGADVIFHQAAMRSVPRSVADPIGANENNVTGTLHVLEAARRAGVRRVVYASSSSVYGDGPELPKRERSGAGAHLALCRLEGDGRAVRTGLASTLRGGDRGPALLQRLRPAAGPGGRLRRRHPAVHHLAPLSGEPLEIYGDGAQSRDFTYVDNVVDANLRRRDRRAPGAGVQHRVR